jgi:hypothetical protein
LSAVLSALSSQAQASSSSLLSLSFLFLSADRNDWSDSEINDSPKLKFGELINGAKTKAGPLEAEQMSRLGHIALVSR